MADYVFFSVAFSFADTGTVMPSFVGMMTDSKPIIGLVGTIFAGAWLIPQLGAATVLNRQQRKKPALMAAVYSGRPLFFILAALIWAGLTRHPEVMLTVFFTLIGVFSVLDGIASVAWFDILARAVPVTRRGRLLGVSQLLSGVLGVVIARLVEIILVHPALPFPSNYALLFALAAVAFIPSAVALALLKEPEEELVNQERLSLREQLKELVTLWRGDPTFRQLMASRWLTGLMDLSVSFYVLHAVTLFGISQGRLLAARTVGSIVASLGLGWLSDRRGPLPVIRVGSLTALGSPLLAMGLHLFVSPTLPQAEWIYLAVYFLLGFTLNSRMLGHFNYVLEMAPEGKRPLYIGLSSTLTGVLVPASFLGGVLLQVTSYPVLFGITAACIVGGVVASFKLRRSVE